MTTILVTGGSGFIGSHTCLILLDSGHELIVLDSYINSSPIALERVSILNNNLDSITIIQGDIRDAELLSSIFLSAISNGKPIQAVIHFAGLKSVAESVNEPMLYWDVNVAGAINLFQTMDEFNCRTIVFSSSATIYGSSVNELLTEESELKPINPYGQTKLVVEEILNSLYENVLNNWRIACLRYFNPVGAHPSGKIGEHPLEKPNNLFPYISQVAVGLRDSLTIFGNDWPTIDGTGVRDYIHVMDLAEAHSAALQYLLGENRSLIKLNIGTGKGTSVLELVKTFEAVNKCQIPYVFSNRRLGDVPFAVANNQLALKYLDWKPKRTLEDICRDGWQWQKLNPSGYSR
ncbi:MULTISPECIES: UDP-glucose 4-epimerase GalE [Prochlorococcus]|uniref:UDP-glucose 4-epimerase GalE n=1 Tax=Prochlorococcus TaxID=1218 RepID=UPI0005337DBC|nr:MULTISPECIES: UDP-glucose 4-epimerase GalE [Prochlorococcus]KGG12046.1 UDP-glucose 4-epimerase [Prochlorococcus sp. MIT 0601]